MPKFIDRTGTRVGRVNIIDFSHMRSGGSIWNCICDCGHKFKSWSVNFKRGDKFECKKCILERRRGIDLVGRKFGRWTVLKRELNYNNKTVWHCICDCGTEGRVAGCVLGKKGRSESCGCLGRKRNSKWANSTLYPPSHKLAKTPFYTARVNLIHKCYREKHPSYKKFGAKGITFCELWRNGAKDMYEWALSQGWQQKDIICLKDGAKEFNPENCFILSNDEFRSEIALKGGDHITYKGETHSVSKWAEMMNINKCSLRRKLSLCPSVEEVFESTFKKCRFYNNPEEVNLMIKLYIEGKSQTEIAKSLKTLPQNVRYYLVKNDIELRQGETKKYKRQEIKDEDILELHSKGLSINSIAKKLNCSFPTIKRRLKLIEEKNV